MRQIIATACFTLVLGIVTLGGVVMSEAETALDLVAALLWMQLATGPFVAAVMAVLSDLDRGG